MNSPGVNQYRVLRSCSWSVDGITISSFTPGEVLTDKDPRINETFIQHALTVNWITLVEPNGPTRTTSEFPPMTRDESPADTEQAPARKRRRA